MATKKEKSNNAYAKIENLVMEKQNEEVPVDYQDIYNRALGLGMKFPTEQQVQTYTVEKSTAVRMYGAE